MNPYQSPTTSSEEGTQSSRGGVVRILICLFFMLASLLFALLALTAFLVSGTTHHRIVVIAFGMWGFVGCASTFTMGMGALRKRLGWTLAGLIALIGGTVMLMILMLA